MADASAKSADVRRQQATLMLDQGAKPSVVAKACGISTRQLRRWTAGRTKAASPVVVAAVSAAEAATVSAVDETTEAMHRIAGELSKSIDAIVAIRDGIDVPPADRLRAAMTLLDRGGVVAGSKIAHEVKAVLSVEEMSRMILALPVPPAPHEPAGNREAVAK